MTSTKLADIKQQISPKLYFLCRALPKCHCAAKYIHLMW